MAEILIFDTDILIDYLLGIAAAKTFFAEFPKTSKHTSVISVMEICHGARNKQELNIFKRFFFASFNDILQINENISRKAVELVQGYTLSHGLRLADALIASIVLFNEGQIITGNCKHFDFIPGLNALTPPYRTKIEKR